MSVNQMKQDEDGLSRSIPSLIMRLGRYIAPYKFRAIFVVFLMGIVMLVNVINPYLMGVAINEFIANNDTEGLLKIGLFMLILNVISLIASRIRWVMISGITNRILVNIRHELFEHIQRLSFTFFDNRPVGKILARVMGDVNSLQNLFNQSIQTLIPEFLTLIAVTVIMFMMNWKLALATLIVLPFLIGCMIAIQIFARKRWSTFRQKRSNLIGFTHESLSGIRTVQSFAKEEDKKGAFKENVSDMIDNHMKAINTTNLLWPLAELSWGIGIVIVYFVGFLLIQKGEIEFGTVVSFSMYVGMFWGPVMNLSNFYNTLISNFSAADRIFDIIDIDPDIASDENAPKIGKIQGEVTFNNVSFGYDDNVAILKNVNFKVNHGEKIALVGATGAGKSTIVSLISRFYDPTEGEVLVDGQNIKHVDLESYRSQMGIMLQDTFLFSNSIMKNIRYGKLDATDEEVIAAAKAVHAHEFIEKMEDGYDTKVNERGSRLSLGQRQLISFARALLADPSILILDEATANIDTQTEILVQQGIEKLLEGRTSFVIAHRLSTIRDCDKIMVIGDGEVKELGTHEELLALKGHYHKLYTAQFNFLNE